MKYDFAYFHNWLLKEKSLHYEQTKDCTEYDCLLNLLNSEVVEDLNEIEWIDFAEDIIGFYNPPGNKELRSDYLASDKSYSLLEDLINNIISRPERIRILTFLRDNCYDVLFVKIQDYYNNYDALEEDCIKFENECARLISYNLKQSEHDKYHGNVKPITKQDLIQIALGKCSTPSILNDSYVPKNMYEQLQKRHADLHGEFAKLQANFEAKVHIIKTQEETINKYIQENKNLKIEVFNLSKELDLKNGIAFAQDQVSSTKQKYIPEPFNSELGMCILLQLEKKGIIQKNTQDVYYPENNTCEISMEPICYTWKATKALYGYFVDKMSLLFELRTSGGMLQWKKFEPLFTNAQSLQAEALAVVSKYTKSKRYPENAEIIEEAIKYAETEPWKNADYDRDNLPF